MSIKKLVGRVCGVLLAALLIPVKLILFHALLISLVTIATALLLAATPILGFCIGIFANVKMNLFDRSVGMMLLAAIGVTIAAPFVLAGLALVETGMLLADIFSHTKRGIIIGMRQGFRDAITELFSGKGLGVFKYIKNYYKLAKQRYETVAELFKKEETEPPQTQAPSVADSQEVPVVQSDSQAASASISTTSTKVKNSHVSTGINQTLFGRNKSTRSPAANEIIPSEHQVEATPSLTQAAPL